MTGDDIRALKPFDAGAYDQVPLTDLAALALLKLERMGERLSIENACVALQRMFPAKFALVGYPEHPDGMRVNRTLLQMQPKYRNYATGSPTKGYSLTPLGRRMAEQISGRMAGNRPDASRKGQLSRVARDSPMRTLTDNDVVAGVRSSELYRSFASTGLGRARGIYFLGMLGAFSHTPKEELRRRLKERVAAAAAVQDKEILRFLRECEREFASLL